MGNNKKILINFSLYLLTLLLIIIVGISNVFADSYDGLNFSAQLYDNLGPTLNAVTTNFEDGDNSYYGFIGLTAYSSGGAWGISSPTPLLANHTYTMSVELYTTGCGNVVLSTFNRIGVGTSLSNARTSYMNNSYVTENYSNNTAYNILQFAFTPSINGSHIVFAYSSTSSGNNCTSALKSVAFQDLGSSGVTETTINNSLNNQTNILNNSIIASTNDITNNSNNNRDAIINNQNSNRDAIINNQNENTQQQIESQQVCKSISKNNIKNDGYLRTNGVIEDNEWALNTFGITDYLITKNSTFRAINIYNNTSSAFCFYDNDYNLLSCKANSTMTENGLISVPSNAYYVRFSILKKDDIPRITYCGNGNQALNDSVNNLNDSINNDDTGSANNDTASFITGFNTNTFGLTSIITAPLNLIQSLTSKTCTSLHLPLPYLNNKYLDLPCMSTIYSQHFGSFFTLYQTITYGIIAYWVCVRIFNHVKDFKNPEHDEIEVVDL